MKTHNFMEERMKWDNDLDEEYRNLLKRFKKREKLLAPLMFPYMEGKWNKYGRRLYTTYFFRRNLSLNKQEELSRFRTTW